VLTKHERTEKGAKMREDFGFGGGEFDDYDPDKGDGIGQELDMADPNYSLDDGDDYLECEWEE
jgi:hypothetical protein